MATLERDSSAPSVLSGVYEGSALTGVAVDRAEFCPSSVEVVRVPRLPPSPSAPRLANRCSRSLLEEQWLNRPLPAGAAPPPVDAAVEETVCGFIDDSQVVLAEVVRSAADRSPLHAFVRAGPRAEVVFGPGEVVAAVVTCGGLCPGLNDVVMELVRCLLVNYRAKAVYGIRDGLRGFYEPAYLPWAALTLDDVRHVHRSGGTFLGSSRGGFDLERIVGALAANGVNHLYVVGGDGTQRAANLIYEECARRGMRICVATVPKTIDNDIGVIDRSFGFFTCVHEAVKAIRSARVEADSCPGGVGVVKLMGRESGFIAAHATLASREVDLCLVPEVPAELEGPHGALEYVAEVVRRRGHAVVVLAEGALAEALPPAGHDESGNRKLPDVGTYLKERVEKHLKSAGVGVSIKYHDPSYMIRSVPASAADSVYCAILAQNAVHGCMAGYTGFCSAMVNNRTVYLPIPLVTKSSPAHMNPTGRTWDRVVACTQQPCFHPARKA